MLQLVDIKKDYFVANQTVSALKGVSLNFRKSEFVSILGPSGCGKTTLLNIIGGLDKYTSGDLIIEGRSTKQYDNSDWDTYRNHSIGFIFQSYHLIPHQTILQNVELALTIAGVSKEERRQRAIDALDKVGLKDKMKNRPNQLSGGQAQRVAIARALINDPEIVLADEPTGALDSVTSVQIMELLKEISKDRLVIMVTHNPELAEQYSTRIVSLKDGEVINDSMPYSDKEEAEERAEAVEEAEGAVQADGGEQPAELVAEVPAKKNKGRKKQSSMSVGMAMGLSAKNLLSKRKRTAMVSIAGSIGIIGVSMVLAISAGVHNYINTMENDMLSGYPLSITQTTFDFSTLSALSEKQDIDLKEVAGGNKVYVNSLLKTLGTFSTGFEKTNQLTDDYLAYLEDMPEEYINVMQYQYAFNVVNNIYTDFVVSENLAEHFDEGKYNSSIYKSEFNMSVAAIRSMYAGILSKVEKYGAWGEMISSVATFAEIPNKYDYIMSQYDVIASVDSNGNLITDNFSESRMKDLFESKNTLVMVLDDYQLDDLTLAQYGYFTEDEFLDYAFKGVNKDENENLTLVGDEGLPFSMFVGKDSKKFAYYPNNSIYTLNAVKNYSTEEIIESLEGTGFPTEQAQLILTGMEPLRGDKDKLKEYLNQTVRPVIIQGALAARPDTDPAMIETVAASMVENMVEEFRIHSIDEQKFTASAYSDGFSDKNKVDLSVNLILQKKEDVKYGCLESGIYYTNALTKHILDTEKDSEIVEYINANGPLKSVSMPVAYYYVDPVKDKADQKTWADKSYYVLGVKEGTVEGQADLFSSIVDSIVGWGGKSSAFKADMFGGSTTPIAIYIYPKDFEFKDKVTAYLDAWNDACKNGTTITLSDGRQITDLEEGNKITYSDTVGLIIGMINTMIKMITIALVAFTALSLVVSTVMIGIITYVSVVERVKEIGILRAVGARKKDIKRLFNSETLVIGLIAGLFGILVTYLLSLVVNVIVRSAAGFWGIAALPWWQAIIMVGLSVGLTLISGLIPASAAAKKDPVVALRTE